MLPVALVNGFYCSESAPFFGFIGVAAALVFASQLAAALTHCTSYLDHRVAIFPAPTFRDVHGRSETTLT